MKLGFVGSGVITEAVVTALLKSRSDISRIVVSPRNVQVASRLAGMSPLIRIGRDNLDVVDASDMVFLAVRPQISEEVITALQFRPDQHVVSLIATLRHETLAEWIRVPAKITRAIPLPTVADLQGMTAIFPPDARVADLFSSLGPLIQCRERAQFDLVAVASALMGTYFGMLEICEDWLVGEGLEREHAGEYLKHLVHGLSRTMMTSDAKSFTDLRHEHTTPGGLNDQMFDIFRRHGGAAGLQDGLASIFNRVEGSGK
ncbi:pyrroline-5-carboxylate reductase [Paraburkholderia silviterrae]|uniref:Pyrroline-5-carboxylate reductase n=1 Tax=Paraburkholderia silviterrae TaxID=2528715 RepID=A0A4R5LXK5_9BURK|nr:pyrroline-5-carboxylate reductase [Paraburkholderia silviterrae]TDG16811.1 pyrroline-5-carboxylate reductase [Paraburkholderia silviterrae]